MLAGKQIRILIDTGTSKNYLKASGDIKGVQNIKNPFMVHSIHNHTIVKQKCKMHLFGRTADFFILPNLQTFDAIIGLDLLNAISAKLDFRTKCIQYDMGQERFKFSTCETVNFINMEDIDVPENIKISFTNIIKKYAKVFADPNENLPFNTNILATIRTRSDEAIYSKSYPYPMGVADFVSSEIKDLLKNRIIRPSRSPYNNPVWVVDKKGFNEDGNRKKRLVIDFRKLNAVTIDDKYPIPNISVIISNLGKAKYFSTLDLKSGFHQIELAERDREKTAFSVNNGKYEYCRLPFGLKNAPSIFQRAIDDILRDQIGKTCHVYIDDVIIFSKSEEEHCEHITWVLAKLLEANMRVSVEKSKFFKTSVEYLGFLVSMDGLSTSPEKIETIKNYPQPGTLFHLRSFLGLASYYRCFIKDYAKMAKPLTDELKGENGKVSASQSKKIKIQLNENQISAFKKIRQILISEDVMLKYPDFKKTFDLTTDASSLGLGAVLSQDGRPIQFISRTLKGPELNFATNERELLAIVWALRVFRHYLYGVKSLNIYTDHQPLTFAVSDRNPNAKIKRWKAFIDEHNANVIYKPGKENVVADALSRQEINNLSVQTESNVATVHSEQSLTYAINSTENPVNCYKNQIIITETDHCHSKKTIVFGKKLRHTINYSEDKFLFKKLNEVISTLAVNAIHCDLHTLAKIQDTIIRNFPTSKFWYAKLFVIDIFNPDDQKHIMATEHNRAHRAAQENTKQVLKDYYFPKMQKMATEIVSTCKICARAKYDRHPKRHKISETTIPSYVGEILHIDIYSTDKTHFLTCIDKFSKFAIVQPIESRTIHDVKIPILQLINTFPAVKIIYCDNEKSINSTAITTLLHSYGITIANAPPLHSSSNGQVERFHSTLSEIARCFKIDKNIEDTVELILKATVEYNKTIHSVTGKTPLEIIHSISPQINETIKQKLIDAQTHLLATHNRNKICKSYNVGDKVLVKRNKRLGNKLSPIYEEEKIQADLGTTVLIKGRVVHKDNLK